MPTSAPTEVDPATLIDWMTDPEPVTVLDVGSPAEFEAAHLAGSDNRGIQPEAQQLLDRLPTYDGVAV